MKCCKFVKWCVITIVALVLAFGIALAVHPLWVGAVIKHIAGEAVPKLTGTKFEIGDLGLNLYSGSVKVGALKLWNPANYHDEYAFTVDSFSLDLDMSTLNSGMVVVKDVTIDGVYATYVKADGKYNFDIIVDNAKSASNTVQPADVAADATVPETRVEKRETKVVIDRLTIKNVKVKYGFIVIPVPVDIVLTDLGRDSGGVSIIEVANKIGNSVLNGVVSVGVGLESLGKGSLDVGGQGLKSAGESLKGAGKFLKNVGDDLKGLFKKK